MKLEVSQGLWVAASSLEHRVCVALVLERSATIWTGATDGKIFLWSTKDVVPLALLCGHTSAIAGLQPCDPSHTQHQDAVLSVCSDRGMCVWDSATGKCLRRRQLPLSVFEPTAVSSLPGDAKHVCIGYYCHGKGGVLIVDTRTLKVTQNIYHGSLGVGKIKDFVVVNSEYQVVAVDRESRLQVFSKNKSNHEVWFGSSPEAEEISLSNHAEYVLLVYRSEWVLKARKTFSIVSQEDCPCLVGGYFLRDAEEHRFLVWDEQGSARFYAVKADREGTVSADFVGVIPGSQEVLGGNIIFCSSSNTVVRIDYNREATVSVFTTCFEDSATVRPSFAGSGCLSQPASKIDKSITSSLIVPRYGSQLPSALVCGYSNGDLEIIELDSGKNRVFSDESPTRPSVECLAVHQSESNQVLLSGTADGTVCLWDTAAEKTLIAVLHPHVAPVRQFVLPSTESSSPWDQCFVSVADDASVALSSLSSLRTERIFPGHAGEVQQVVWDEFRAYLAVLCVADDCHPVLYIWDIHSGARERILREAAAHPMLKHFASRRRRTSELYGDLTSASSLRLPLEDVSSPQARSSGENIPSKQRAIRTGCPFPGIAAIHFDMTLLLSTVDEKLLKMSLSMLHFWGISEELDRSITNELQVLQPCRHRVAAAIAGNRGSVTLILPTREAASKFWSSSPALFSVRALTMVSLAQRLLAVSAPGSMICSALAAFYTAGAVQEHCGPCLEIYACFWQDPAEHVRLAARLLFHAAASTSVPDILKPHHNSSSADLLDWLESSQEQETWLGITGGSDQDGRACRIIVCAALAVWHKSLIRDDLPSSTAPLLLKLVRTSDRHSATAAELLCAGMATIWQRHVQPEEVSQLSSDVLALVQCIGGDGGHVATAEHHRELLSALALADMLAFVTALERVALQRSSTVLLGLASLVRVVRSSPSSLTTYLGRVISLAMHLLDPADSTQRRSNFATVVEVIKEIAEIFPMVAVYHPVLHAATGKIAVGDPIGDIRSLRIHVYDLQSASIMKVLDASGPPGHPALSPRARNSTRTQGITALSFSKDGEGLVAFSHRGLILRWWSVGAAWWDKLSRSTVPVQCTKLVLLPPSPGFSPKSSSSSIIGKLTGSADDVEDVEEEGESEQTIDLSFWLQWTSDRTVALSRGNQQVGIFQL